MILWRSTNAGILVPSWIRERLAVYVRCEGGNCRSRPSFEEQKCDCYQPPWQEKVDSDIEL